MYVHLIKKKNFLSKPDTRPPQKENGHQSMLRNKSVFTPQNVDNKFLDVFRNMVTEDLENVRVRKVNYPYWIRKGIESIEQNKYVVISPANKGGVIMSKKYYQMEMERQLVDSETYYRHNENPLVKK